MAFSVYTSEIRWFGEGPFPEKIFDLLRQLPGMYEEHPERTDVYLLVNRQPDLGIKLREGRVELKKRIRLHDDYRSGNLSGKMESWVKWSIQATRELDPFHAMFQNPKHWVNIRKKRTLVKFGITSDETLTLPPADRYPDNGITMELSILEIKKTTCWTVGLECFGFPDRVFNNLLKLTPQILGNLPLNGCTVANSFGYPEWISKIVQTQKTH